jgi:hypothetical protein
MMRRYTERVTVTLPHDVKASLVAGAASRGISLSALMREITGGLIENKDATAR